ncbi:MAG: 5'/3'-nucleotidase SurE, partial [Elusimicrobiota bacterium]
MSRSRILVVNDDGWNGSGLHPLIEALSRLGRVCVVVPERERSAESHCLTLHKPLRAREVRRGVFLVNGSPADCARLGVCELMKGRVDALVSGINLGYFVLSERWSNMHKTSPLIGFDKVCWENSIKISLFVIAPLSVIASLPTGRQGVRRSNL